MSRLLLLNPQLSANPKLWTSLPAGGAERSVVADSGVRAVVQADIAAPAWQQRLSAGVWGACLQGSGGPVRRCLAGLSAGVWQQRFFCKGLRGV